MIPLRDGTCVLIILLSFLFLFLLPSDSGQAAMKRVLAIKQHEKENHKTEKAYAFSLSMEPETRSTTWTTKKPEILWILSTAFDSTPTPMPQSIGA